MRHLALILVIFSITLANAQYCHLNETFFHSAALDDDEFYQFSLVSTDNEFIVQFNGFYEKHFRHKLIRNLFMSANISDFAIAQKHLLFDSYPSDFDVVKTDKSVECLRSSRIIKNVYAHNKVIRELNSSRKRKRKKDEAENEPDEGEEAEKKDEEEEEAEENEDEKPKKRRKKRGQNGAKQRLKYKKRKIFRAIPRPGYVELKNVIDLEYVWSRGVTGAHVNVAIFDTGLEDAHPHFRNVIERIDWTNEKNADDRIGHGTFVCGLIASSKDCLGLAPDANLYIFKVFAKNHISYTSWFLDAFNYAIIKKIHVLNLSIGGPDFMDAPFVNKVWEVTSKGIIMVSGIGNDGPLYGTLNNPADQLDIIGVGGINAESKLAKFSSRGMTTWELPDGYGRVKPDIVTYCTHVRGSERKSGCKTLSGTSVASPIVTGSIALLLSAMKKFDWNSQFELNPGSVKQILMASADRIEDANMFEQGFGKLNLVTAFRMIKNYQPQASLIPSYVDLTDCPYFWPFCSQPLYYSALPIIVNVTILNGIDAFGQISKKPEWHPSLSGNGHLLKVSISYSAKLWPWSGYLGVKIGVNENGQDYSGLAEGQIKLTVESKLGVNGETVLSDLSLFVRAKIIPRPNRRQRLLWDQYHNLRYPPGFFPHDNLKTENDPLDWNGDHLHTNFKEMYQHLRNSGYFLEVLGENYNCFNASNYGALLIIDPEEEFHESEIEKLTKDVLNEGLSVIVFADWYNTSVMNSSTFYDENSRRFLTPVTGGSNIPALNNLLKPYGIALGDRVYDGEIKIREHSAGYMSGSSIVKFPRSNVNYLVYRELTDYGEEFIATSLNKSAINPKLERVPILGLASEFETPTPGAQQSGRLVVYGDSNCVDSTHLKSDCFWLLAAVVEYACNGIVYSAFEETTSLNFEPIEPALYSDSQHDLFSLRNFSKVLKMDNFSCKSIDYDIEHVQETIPVDQLPTKSNYYNFLKINLTDERSIATEETLNHDDNDNVSNTLPVSTTIESDLSFPFVAFSAVLLVICYIFYRILVSNRRSARSKKSNMSRSSTGANLTTTRKNSAHSKFFK